MNVKKITPVLLVEDVEACVQFWVERLGFTLTGSVPQGDKMGFAMMQKGSAEVMYQSFASIAVDNPNAEAAARKGPTFLYVEVDSLNDTIAAIEGVEVTMPERKTFYGAREIGVRDPGGHSVTFAQFGE